MLRRQLQCQQDEAGQLRSPKMRGKTMVKTYRDVAIEQMIVTVEEAMSQVLDYWGDLPPSMKEAVEQFRSRLGAAIDSVEFVRRALARQVHGN
jgi:Ribonuclease G/E